MWLEGNPLSYAPFYRLDVLAWFDTSQLCLDGVHPKSSESSAVAMRATGEVPLAWQIMAQYVSQQELLWRPKEACHSSSKHTLELALGSVSKLLLSIWSVEIAMYTASGPDRLDFTCRLSCLRLPACCGGLAVQGGNLSSPLSVPHALLGISECPPTSCVTC